MRCEVLAIGTELLLGQIVDTNSAWIGEQLAASGIDSYEHRAIGDNQARIVAALRDLLARSDAVLVCGGLGPTQDDLTRDAIAEVMGVPLVRRDELAEVVAHRLDALDAGGGNPTIAFLARGIEGLVVRVTAKAATEADARALVDLEEKELRLVLGDLVFGVDDETMEYAVLERLRGR